MDISFKNFGPLRTFSINLDADFVLIVGENNIGKSYAISLLYAILKTLTSNELIDRPYIGEYIIDRISEKASENIKSDLTRQYKQSSEKDTDVTQPALSLTEVVFRILFLDQLEKTIAGTFGDISNLENRRNSDPTIINIATKTLSIEIEIKNGNLSINKITIPKKIIYRKSKQHRIPKHTEAEVIHYGQGDNVEQLISRLSHIGFEIFRSFLDEVVSTISDVHYLPASRSGLYQALSAFGQIIAELSKRRSFLSQRIELPEISEPLVDYFLKLNEIKPSKKAAETSFYTVAEELERNVLGGSVEFDTKNKKLFYKPFDVDLKLDLSSTSSMVSEVSPIVTYLKHVLPESEIKRGSRRYLKQKPSDTKRKQIVFIEEPEAHLHPNTQVMLMDAFAKLVKNSNVKIIMTSHSNFVFNKTSNLVISKSFGQSKIEAFLFARGINGTESKKLDVDELGVSDENFSEISEILFEEKISLIENCHLDTGS